MISIVLILITEIDRYLQLLFLFLCVFHYLKYDLKNNHPCMDVAEIRLSPDKCTLKLTNDSLIQYHELKIPIHNNLFQLIQLRGQKNNKILVLFNDQLRFDQLRLFHVKVGMMKKEKTKLNKSTKA